MRLLSGAHEPVPHPAMRCVSGCAYLTVRVAVPETVFAEFPDAFAVNAAVVPIICVVLFGCCVNAALTFTFLWELRAMLPEPV